MNKTGANLLLLFPDSDVYLYLTGMPGSDWLP